ncbi:helix-turn-helix transcriptional regulator [uncultured Sphingomonas sp.]|uniref:helix-turn-helix transcriptional regulator n=1 Tax=uncultured Sphingomonas sp. TaxID=158754 RepID=UPI0035CA9FA5
MTDEKLVDLIYDAPYDDRLWSPLLGELADRSGAHPANFLEMNVLDGHGDGICARTPTDILQLYRAEWAQANCLLLVDDLTDYASAWAPRITRDSDWIDREDFERSAYLNEFLDPIGAAHNLSILLSLEGPWLTTIGLGRSRRQGPFEDRDIAAVAPFQPHLIRAARLRRELALRQEQLDHLDVLLATSPQAMFFIDESLRVVRHSAAGEALMEGGTTLRLVNGRLRAVAAIADRALEAALTSAFRTRIPGAPIILPGRDRRSDRSVTVSRMGERAIAGFASARCVLVTVADVAPPRSTPQDKLRQAFGLTGAESRLALRLWAGESLSAVSESGSVSIHTVRNQLKAVFHKTGCARQQDLVRLLAGLDLPSASDH